MMRIGALIHTLPLLAFLRMLHNVDPKGTQVLRDYHAVSTLYIAAVLRTTIKCPLLTHVS